jgi:hypothetical protein
MWVCPTCHREFRMKNQDHSCAVFSEDHLFASRPPKIREIYNTILSLAEKAGPLRITYLDKAVIVAARSTFLAIKPKKDYVEVEFVLDEAVEEFPVYKTVRVSSRKVAHFIKIGDFEDADKKMQDWILLAYQINSAQEG